MTANEVTQNRGGPNKAAHRARSGSEDARREVGGARVWAQSRKFESRSDPDQALDSTRLE